VQVGGLLFLLDHIQGFYYLFNSQVPEEKGLGEISFFIKVIGYGLSLKGLFLPKLSDRVDIHNFLNWPNCLNFIISLFKRQKRDQ
jgi:hypothetical protein